MAVRVVMLALVMLTLATLCRSAPVEEDILYDQRQNGTENYRLHVDGVVVAVAPADTFLALASLADDIFLPENLFGSGDNTDINNLLGLGGDNSTTSTTSSSSGGGGSTTESPAAPSVAASGVPSSTTVADPIAASSTEKPQQGDAAHKPTKTIRGKLLLSRLLMPLLRRL